MRHNLLRSMAHRFGAYTGDDGGHENGNYDDIDCHDDDGGDNDDDGGDNDDDENVCVEEARYKYKYTNTNRN